MKKKQVEAEAKKLLLDRASDIAGREITDTHEAVLVIRDSMAPGELERLAEWTPPEKRMN